MFSPKALWPLTPMSETLRKKGPADGPDSDLGSDSLRLRIGDGSVKGKAVSLLDGDNGVMEYNSLTERLTSLENELFEYQYNMGLLLIEKKEWMAKYEELSHAASNATEAIKREQAAHAIAISEVEKREENLKKALGVERQCVLDLEKALHEMRSEYAEVKFNADCKLAEANAMITSVDEKSLEVESKFHAADAKLAEVNRKSSEIEMKWNELVLQENTLRRERSSFDTERKSRDSAISKQREDLREWERKLQEGEERLADTRRMLNHREERANENDNLLKEKQNDLDELKKKLEASSSNLREKEDDINKRIADLTLHEKESADKTKRLEEKEKQLSELEDKLNSREKIEMQKLLDQHKLSLEEKQKIFDLELENKRKLNEEELKSKLVEVERREAEVAHMEKKVSKREQVTENKMEKIMEKEKEYELKSKDLKEREQSLSVELEKLENEKKHILVEKEELYRMISDLEKLKTETNDLQLKLNEERENLRITEEERNEHLRLQSELKLEIERYRLQNKQLLAEADGLKMEREKFEKEWEELDFKRSEIKKEQEELLEKKIHFEKLVQSDEERMRTEKREIELYVQRELEDLKLAKESFAANMEHEKSMLAEKMQSEKSGLVHDFEMKKQELEGEFQRKQEDMESRLLDKEKAFEEQREMDLSNINYLREVAQREMEEMKLERAKNEKERMDISQNKDHLEAQQREMKKDIEELVSLSQKLKDQREEFIKERERFASFIDKQKSCNSCGEIIREFVLSDLCPLTELENIQPPKLPKLAEDYLEDTVKGKVFNANSSPVAIKSRSPTAGGTISWLRKCTSKIFKLSPGTRLQLEIAEDSVKKEVLTPTASPDSEKEQEPSKQEIGESNSGMKDTEAGHASSIAEDPLNVPETSQSSGMRTRRHGLVKVARSLASREPSANTDHPSNGIREVSHENNQSFTECDDVAALPKGRQKRGRTGSQAAASEDDQTEDQSDSGMNGVRPKRRQRVVEAESLGQKRYNLRQPKKSAVTLANGIMTQDKKRKGKGKGNNGTRTSKSEMLEVASQTRSSAAASDFSFDSPLNTNATLIDHVSDDDKVVSGEKHETPKSAQDAGLRNGEDSSDDDEEVNHPGEASLGKKILKFLVT